MRSLEEDRYLIDIAIGISNLEIIFYNKQSSLFIYIFGIVLKLLHNSHFTFNIFIIVVILCAYNSYIGCQMIYNNYNKYDEFPIFIAEKKVHL